MRSEEFTKHKGFDAPGMRSASKKKNGERSDFEKNVGKMRRKERALKPQKPISPIEGPRPSK